MQKITKFLLDSEELVVEHIFDETEAFDISGLSTLGKHSHN